MVFCISDRYIPIIFSYANHWNFKVNNSTLNSLSLQLDQQFCFPAEMGLAFRRASCLYQKSHHFDKSRHFSSISQKRVLIIWELQWMTLNLSKQWNDSHWLMHMMSYATWWWFFLNDECEIIVLFLCIFWKTIKLKGITKKEDIYNL